MPRPKDADLGDDEIRARLQQRGVCSAHIRMMLAHRDDEGHLTRQMRVILDKPASDDYACPVTGGAM